MSLQETWIQFIKLSEALLRRTVELSELRPTAGSYWACANPEKVVSSQRRVPHSPPKEDKISFILPSSDAEGNVFLCISTDGSLG